MAGAGRETALGPLELGPLEAVSFAGFPPIGELEITGAALTADSKGSPVEELVGSFLTGFPPAGESEITGATLAADSKGSPVEEPAGSFLTWFPPAGESDITGATLAVDSKGSPVEEPAGSFLADAGCGTGILRMTV